MELMRRSWRVFSLHGLDFNSLCFVPAKAKSIPAKADLDRVAKGCYLVDHKLRSFRQAHLLEPS